MGQFVLMVIAGVFVLGIITTILDFFLPGAGGELMVTLLNKATSGLEALGIPWPIAFVLALVIVPVAAFIVSALGGLVGF